MKIPWNPFASPSSHPKNDSIKNDVQIKLVEDETKEEFADILKELPDLFEPQSYTYKIFSEEGSAGLRKYLETVQNYDVITTAANWGLSRNTIAIRKGYFGNHAVIR
jgi:hypothetical protein